jgi:hypothetical protein
MRQIRQQCDAADREYQDGGPPRADREPHRRAAGDPPHGVGLRREGDPPARPGTGARRHLPPGHRRRDEGDGPVRAHDPRGVRRPGRVPADLCAGRRADRPRLDERQRHHQHALHRRLHAHAARHRRAEAALPAEDGRGRDPRLVLDVRAGQSRPRPRPTATTSSSTAPRCGSPTAARRT